MKADNPVEKFELSHLALEIDILLDTINVSQTKLIMQIKNSEDITGTTDNLQDQINRIKIAQQKMKNLKKKISECQTKVEKKYDKMEKLILEKGNSIWQSSIEGLEVN